MKVSEVSNKLFDLINPVFEERGFSLNRQKKQFTRKDNGAIQLFDLFFYKKSDHITIKPEIRIKMDEIEKIYRSITSIESRPYRTLGNHLFEIVRYIDDGVEIDDGEGSLYDWLVEDEESVQKLAQVIPEYFKETILLYFEENSSVARVDELLNKFPREVSIHNPMYPLQANIAIIAAKLNDNPKYDELVAIYDEETQEAEESYREEFIKLKEVLASH